MQSKADRPGGGWALARHKKVIGKQGRGLREELGWGQKKSKKVAQVKASGWFVRDSGSASVAETQLVEGR